MKRLDALVLKELIGPWIFGVSMFTMLLVASIYLGRIAGYVVQGVPAELIVKVTILLLPAVLVKTFAMASLLGGLLAFGRLSGDSEITAIRAAGVSLYRIVAPVAAFSFLIAFLAFFLNERVVPAATQQSVAIMGDIGKGTQLHSKLPVKYIEKQNGKVVAMVGALDFSLLDKALRGVHVVFYDKNEQVTFIMFADELSYTPGNLHNWEIRRNAEVLSRDGSYHAVLHGVWPEKMPEILSSPEDIFASQSSDSKFDALSMSQIRDQIEKGKKSGNLTTQEINDFEYGYWNKIALPLATFIFGTLGATLGIRNHRTGAATGFAVSVAIIFSYFTLANFMNVYAMNGVFPPYVASMTPIAIGLVASGVIIWRRNR